MKKLIIIIAFVLSLFYKQSWAAVYVSGNVSIDLRPILPTAGVMAVYDNGEFAGNFAWVVDDGFCYAAGRNVQFIFNDNNLIVYEPCFLVFDIAK